MSHASLPRTVSAAVEVPTEVVTSEAVTAGASPKAVLATAATTALSMILAVLNLVNTAEGAHLLGGLHPIAQTLLIVMVPPLVVGITTYRAAVGRVALKG